jgi:hypothetical protein
VSVSVSHQHCAHYFINDESVFNLKCLNTVECSM